MALCPNSGAGFSEGQTGSFKVPKSEAEPVPPYVMRWSIGSDITHGPTALGLLKFMQGKLIDQSLVHPGQKKLPLFRRRTEWMWDPNNITNVACY